MISVTILTKNSTTYLAEVLQALQAFPEVVIYDTGSTDETMTLAHTFPNVVVYQAPFEGFGPSHNKASASAKYDWILSIDSDEVATPEMVQDILNASLDPKSVYSFPRHNWFNGKFIKWCGWYPDRQVRLYHRGNTRFTDAQVHEAVITEGMHQQKMQGPIKHYSYACMADFLVKMQAYSTLFAQQNAGKKHSSPLKAVLHGWFAFFKSYILKRGILGGYEGFVISSYNAHTAYYKYLKLYELNAKQSKGSQKPVAGSQN